MRILVAGAHGQIAQALIPAAIRDPRVTVCAVGRSAYDLCAPGAVAAAMAGGAPDVVINTAAFTDVDAAEARETDAHRLNCDGARRLAAEAARTGTPIIHLSTNYVFDGAKPSPYQPDDATAPLNAYGRTKLAGEHSVRAANPRHLIVRTSWVLSELPRSIVTRWGAIAGRETRVCVVADEVGTPAHAAHIAEALLSLAVQARDAVGGDRIWGTYHLAGTGEASWADIAERVFNQKHGKRGRATEVERVASRDFHGHARRPLNCRLSSDTLRVTFGISLPDWKAAVDACLAPPALQSRSTGPAGIT